MTKDTPKNYYIDKKELTDEVIKCQNNNNTRSNKLDKLIVQMTDGFIKTYHYADPADAYDAKMGSVEELLDTWWKFNCHPIVHLKKFRFYVRLRGDVTDMVIVERATKKSKYILDIERSFENILSIIRGLETISVKKVGMALNRYNKVPSKSKYTCAFPLWTQSCDNGIIATYRLKNKIKTISYDNVFEDGL